MNREDILTTAAAMRTYGGSFVSAIGEALRYADPENSRRLCAAFPELMLRYGPLSQAFASVKPKPITDRTEGAAL